jgi:hypothetical protein
MVRGEKLITWTDLSIFKAPEISAEYRVGLDRDTATE